MTEYQKLNLRLGLHTVIIAVWGLSGVWLMQDTKDLRAANAELRKYTRELRQELDDLKFLTLQLKSLRDAKHDAQPIPQVDPIKAAEALDL